MQFDYRCLLVIGYSKENLKIQKGGPVPSLPSLPYPPSPSSPPPAFPSLFPLHVPSYIPFP